MLQLQDANTKTSFEIYHIKKLLLHTELFFPFHHDYVSLLSSFFINNLYPTVSVLTTEFLSYGWYMIIPLSWWMLVLQYLPHSNHQQILYELMDQDWKFQ